MSKTVIIKDNFKLNNEYKIADIYFGIVDADNEYKKDKQAFIDNYYDLNEAAKKIEEQNNIQYIFGKKGTGRLGLKITIKI
ncbi:MAG: hypothetical protein K2N95_14685 [Lachnospiraceae bacterium]|nr:hypothetical protein [Lachnospiraceae bacterium]